MALTNTEKSKMLRKRREALNQKELRGVWNTPDEEEILKPKIRAMLKKMRKGT